MKELTTFEAKARRVEKAIKYMRAIRNKDKKRYAWKYHDFITGLIDNEPARPEGLSFMAAQAVRNELGSLYR